MTAIYEGKKIENKTPVTASDSQRNPPPVPIHAPKPAPERQPLDVPERLKKGAEILAEGMGSFFQQITDTGVSASMVQRPEQKREKSEEKKESRCSCNSNLKKEELKTIAIHATQANIDKYFDGFNETFKKFNINFCLQKIHFLSQVIHESGSFRYNVEQGDAAYLAKYGGWHGRGFNTANNKSQLRSV